jgi:hypothetical protein
MQTRTGPPGAAVTPSIDAIKKWRDSSLAVKLECVDRVGRSTLFFPSSFSHILIRAFFDPTCSF